MIVRQMRPRFRVPVPMSPAEVVKRLEERLEGPDCPCRGMIADRHHVVELRVHEKDRNFWSPALSVTVADGEAGEGSVIHGLVGPNPNLWTVFAMAYLGLLTALMFVGTFGLVQWWLDMRPWGLYGVPLLILAVTAMYGLSRMGQRLAAPQTVLLRHFLEDALELPEGERAVTDIDPYHPRPAPR